VSFEIVSSGFQHRERASGPLVQSLKIGLIFGVLSLYLALVGVYLTFDKSWLVVNVLSMGRTLLFVVPLLAGVQIVRRDLTHRTDVRLGGAVLAGVIVGGFTACLIPVILLGDLRVMFVALSPPLAKMLSLGLEPAAGAAVLVVGSAVAALVGALLTMTSQVIRRPITTGLIALAIAALLQELIQLILRGGGTAFSFISRGLFQYGGLTLQGAVIVFLAAAAVTVLATRLRAPFAARFAELPPHVARTLRRIGIVVLLAAVIFFPLIGGPFVAQVFLLVGLYALMGMGLNVEVGLAGLLDLGFVAFFAIGAYSIALLTADSPHALASLSFWAALPIAVLVSVAFGFLFGIPVLGIRGDYLAASSSCPTSPSRSSAAPRASSTSRARPSARSSWMIRPASISSPCASSASPPTSRGASRIHASGGRGWRSATTRMSRRRSASTWSPPSCSPTASARPSPASPGPSSRSCSSRSSRTASSS
jgi:branched-chain amino acid transport system permease protein